MSKALTVRGDCTDYETAESSNHDSAVEEAIDEYFPPSIRRILRERIQRRVAEQTSPNQALGLAIRRMAGRSPKS